ncbi:MULTISPECIES: hypothetical protein [Streptomyces]|uniref:hypothetical protein n=1 Tax=Streptomyces sp. NBC_01373 TaxID=2903843 RepID=UPI00224EFD4F|nr:hypothetical protein [Streptomyces sp. NBC_01373]MCX4697486.1 hypothetical protein [Streptomyces sp. NBC_01373]
MAGPIARWGAVLGLGVLWWWAVLRLALASDAGVLEGAVAAGGWGLSLLPVHCVPKGRAAGAVASGRWTAAWRAARVTRVSGTARAATVSRATTASPHRRSDAGSGPS